MLRHRFLQELLRQKAFDLTGLAGLEPTTYGLGNRKQLLCGSRFDGHLPKGLPN